MIGPSELADCLLAGSSSGDDLDGDEQQKSRQQRQARTNPRQRTYHGQRPTPSIASTKAVGKLIPAWVLRRPSPKPPARLGPWAFHARKRGKDPCRSAGVLSLARRRRGRNKASSQAGMASTHAATRVFDFRGRRPIGPSHDALVPQLVIASTAFQRKRNRRFEPVDSSLKSRSMCGTVAIEARSERRVAVDASARRPNTTR